MFDRVLNSFLEKYELLLFALFSYVFVFCCFFVQGSYRCVSKRLLYIGYDYSDYNRCQLGNCCQAGLHDCNANSICVVLAYGKYYCRVSNFQSFTSGSILYVFTKQRSRFVFFKMVAKLQRITQRITMDPIKDNFKEQFLLW